MAPKRKKKEGKKESKKQAAKGEDEAGSLKSESDEFEELAAGKKKGHKRAVPEAQGIRALASIEGLDYNAQEEFQDDEEQFVDEAEAKVGVN